MKFDAEPMSILDKSMKWLCSGKKIHISIHDASGVFQSNPDLKLHPIYKVHYNDFCNKAKTTCAGLRFCLRCKACSIRKAFSVNEMYVGRCYLGITEIVKPVVLNGRKICVIYLGNMTEEEKLPSIKGMIHKACGITGVKENLLLDALEGTEKVGKQDIEQYKEIVEVVSHLIRQTLLNYMKRDRTEEMLITAAGSGKHWIIDAVENYIRAYYDRDLKLSYLSKLYFVNPDYLCRLFRKETGKNFSEYVNDIRIEKSKQLLTGSDDAIMNIALQVGYNNVTYFNRVFRKQTGISPGEYRKVLKSHGNGDTVLSDKIGSGALSDINGIIL